MWRLFLISVVSTVVTAKDSYVVVVPKNVRPGVPLNISVNILKATNDVIVSAELIHKSSGKHVGNSQDTFTQGVPGTLMIQVPDTLSSGTYKIAVHGTKGLTFSNQTDLHYEHKSLSVFIQTDKAMYKPGQTVNFRAFAIYPNMTVYKATMDIEIYDPNTNKIKQWLGVKDITGVITNFMLMDTQPVLGDWKIKVSANGQISEKVFTVAHYVLPKFEVTVELASFALSSDNDIQGTVKAKYTYGKPVKGTVKIRAKEEYFYKPWNYHGDQPMVEQTLTIDGDAKFTIPLDTIKAVHNRLTGRNIIIEANVTEGLTHITLNGSSKIKFYSNAEKIEFLSSNPNTFKPGLKYTAYVKVAQQDDRPVVTSPRQSSVVVKTTVTYELPEPKPTPQFYYGPQTRNYHIADKTFTVPDTGVVPIQVDIPDNATSINLNVAYGTIHAYKTLSKSYSPSDSYVQVFLKSSKLRAGSVANFDVKSTQAVSELVYQVMSRGSIVAAGTTNGGNSKTFTFGIPVNSKMAPNARIIAYYVRADGEIVTDSISFDVEGVFENQVSIQFDKTKAQPGDNVNVQVTADPQSLVNLLAVDQSVLLLKSGNDITPDQVVDELKSYDTIPHSGGSFFGGGGIIPLGAIARKKRMIWWPYPVYYGGSDAQQIFDNAGVKVITDATVYHHVSRHYILYEKGPFAMALSSSVYSSNVPGTFKEPARIRTNFPETWLWFNYSIGLFPYERNDDETTGCNDKWHGDSSWWCYRWPSTTATPINSKRGRENPFSVSGNLALDK